MAGCQHNLLTAWAKSKGLCSVTLAADLATYYEKVSHSQLWNEGVATGYPLNLLRAPLGFYAGPRLVAYKGVVSHQFSVSGTILVDVRNFGL